MPGTAYLYFVFPEGTRNKSLSEPLGPFKAGAFITAIDAQLPIAPFVVVGGRDLLPNEKLPAQRCNMTAYYADPIETKGLTLDDVEMLKNKTYAIMQQLLIEHDPRFKNYVPNNN
jgi:1-acyl-sn-glycerol-3-phosphate acyltransferase